MYYICVLNCYHSLKQKPLSFCIRFLKSCLVSYDHDWLFTGEALILQSQADAAGQSSGGADRGSFGRFLCEVPMGREGATRPVSGGINTSTLTSTRMLCKWTGRKREVFLFPHLKPWLNMRGPLILCKVTLTRWVGEIKHFRCRLLYYFVYNCSVMMHEFEACNDRYTVSLDSTMCIKTIMSFYTLVYLQLNYFKNTRSLK